VLSGAPVEAKQNKQTRTPATNNQPSKPMGFAGWLFAAGVRVCLFCLASTTTSLESPWPLKAGCLQPVFVFFILFGFDRRAREHLGALVEAKQNFSDAALKYRKQASMHALDLAYFCIYFKLRSLLL